MDNYLGKLASNLGGYPTTTGDLGPLQSKNLLALQAFNDLQKQRLLQAIQGQYLKQGNLSPLEKFGQGTASRMAQADTDGDY